MTRRACLGPALERDPDLPVAGITVVAEAALNNRRSKRRRPSVGPFEHLLKDGAQVLRADVSGRPPRGVIERVGPPILRPWLRVVVKVPLAQHDEGPPLNNPEGKDRLDGGLAAQSEPPALDVVAALASAVALIAYAERPSLRGSKERFLERRHKIFRRGREFCPGDRVQGESGGCLAQ